MSIVDFDLICVSCSGNLKGADVVGDCPHCSTGIGDTINLHVIDAESMTVAEDVACVGCGYNLKTLHVTGRCPECGHPRGGIASPG